MRYGLIEQRWEETWMTRLEACRSGSTNCACQRGSCWSKTMSVDSFALLIGSPATTFTGYEALCRQATARSCSLLRGGEGKSKATLSIREYGHARRIHFREAI